MKPLRTTTVLLCVFLAQAALAANDYWIWVDDNGVTNFSQQKPKGHPAKHVIGSGPYGYHQSLEDTRRPGMAPPPQKKPEDAKPASASKLPQKQANPDALIAAQKEKLKRQIADTKRKNCDQAKQNLKTLQRPRIRTRDANGNIRVMSDKEKQAQIDAAEAAVRDNCSG